MIYNLDGLFGVGFSVSQALRTVMGEILALIYSLIEYLYSVFIYLSRAEILENEFIQSIYKKVGLILGLFMVFKLIFSLIQSLLDPNKLSDKKNGFSSIIWRSVVAIVLLGVTPTLFREAFKLQNLIVGSENSNNVIYKLIAGQSNVGNLDNMGRVLASDLYFSFFSDNEEPFLNNGVDDTMPDTEVIYSNSDSEDAKIYFDRFNVDDYDNLVNKVKSGEYDFDFHDTVPYLAIKNEKTNKYIIEFNWFLLLIVGGFTVWMLFMYCIQVAIRVVQLAYLQLVAPVPILSYISDPDGSFKKWINQCLSTFLDLFLRLAIIYFVMTMIGDVLNQFVKMNGVLIDSTGIPVEDKMTWAIVKIFIIIGLLLFAKKVPELIKDLFPNLGLSSGKFDFGFNPKKTFKDSLVSKAVGGAAGAVAGGAVGLIGGHGFKGRAKGLIGGISKGATSGVKGKKISDIVSARAAQNRKNRAMDEAGSTFGGRIGAKARDTFGMKTKVEKIDDEIKSIDTAYVKPTNQKIKDLQTTQGTNNKKISELDRSKERLQKTKNDSVIASRNAIYNEAESQLLKPGVKNDVQDNAASQRLRDLQLRVNWCNENMSKDVGGYTVTSNDLYEAEQAYKEALDEESKAWIDRHKDDNLVVKENMGAISSATNTQVSDVSAIDEAVDGENGARKNNLAIAAELERQKREREQIEEENRKLDEEIEKLNKQNEEYEKQKEALEKTKKKPQADIDAIKK